MNEPKSNGEHASDDDRSVTGLLTRFSLDRRITVLVFLMTIVVVGVMEVDEDAMRVAIGIQRVDLSEKISVIETVRQEMNKKSPMGRGTDLVDGRETGAKIATARIKKAKDAMEGKVPASIARIVEIQNPTKTLPPLARRPMHPLKRSRGALVSFWLVSSGANRHTKINLEGDAI